MANIKGLYSLQAKLKGKIAVQSLSRESFTTTWYADIFDADTGEERTLDTTGPWIICIDPKNTRKQGLEFVVPDSISQSGKRITFTSTKRGISKDSLDDTGSYDNALAWSVGTELGIVTDFQNSNLLKEIVAGTRKLENVIDFGAGLKSRNTLNFVYTPAYVTSGAGVTSTPETWELVTDGSFTITIDGTSRNITALDFSDVNGMDGVARVIQNKIRTVTSGKEEVEWNGTRLIMRSGNTTSSSAITITSAVAPASGTDISGAGATTFLDMDTGNGTVTNRQKGFLISGSVVDLTEMNALTSVANGAEVYVESEGIKYDYLSGAWTSRDGGAIVANAADHTAGKVDIASDTEVGAHTLVDATSGAINVLSVANTVKTSSGASDENKIVALNSAGQIPNEFVSVGGNNIFGDGSDGAYTASNGTLTADKYCTTVLVPAGVTLNTGGYRIYATQTVTVEATGVIQNNGGNGGDAGNSTINTPGSVGTAGTKAPGITVPEGIVGIIGVAGAAGSNQLGNGTAGTIGNAGGNVVNGISVVGITGVGGGIGGKNNNGNTGGAGGATGAVGTFSASIRKVKTLSVADNLYDTTNAAKFTLNSGSSSSGSGGAGAGGQGTGNIFSGAGGSSGGSGAGGGCVWIASPSIINNGTIKALGGNGGKGGNGGDGGNAEVGVGGGGGGGTGGSGGVVILIYKTKTGSGTVSVLGGTKGNKGTKGVSGNTTNATDGSDGNDGGTGVEYNIVLS